MLLSDFRSATSVVIVLLRPCSIRVRSIPRQKKKTLPIITDRISREYSVDVAGRMTQILRGRR